eukprot:Plantae.Rhodophyta-Purpureofilum_apyrenoidigerum.ctg9904.p1 GENE.Plantae.Rhodophyta-Purpureofilum_apyrenoidigerum.ctg9904~~Plantae.Rhodophyta-Purpureofilum_apyrenoidigerum.ctg9904.p1  ORF type:complete len:391 (+),score=78.51 Plantae.Rhodophyta-Purpureofilum_apyrenoidigerum.ctg9904:95-1267(+)
MTSTPSSPLQLLEASGIKSNAKPPRRTIMGAASVLRGNLAVIDMRVAACMLLNFTSSTGIVIVNKIVMDKFGFNFATTLTCFHFAMTFLCLLVCASTKVFSVKKLPIGPTFKLAAASAGFVVLTNLSLQHNSVGFYQIAKVMTTPTVVLIEAIVYQKYLESNLRWSLLPVCCGVMITAVTDFKLNKVGTLYAIAGVIVTSFYQIWSGSLQKGLDCNALQLQFYTAPMSALFISPFLSILDNYNRSRPDSIFYYTFTPTNLMYIALTGVIAFLVNISIFLVIGKSSPLTYNILGHAKTSFIIMSDFMIFGRPRNLKNVAGVAIALCGVFWYTHLKLEKARKDLEGKGAQLDMSRNNSLKAEMMKSSSVHSDKESSLEHRGQLSKEGSVNNV